MEQDESPKTSPKWQERTLESLLFATIKEQRQRRRWGIFFKLSFLLIILLIVSHACSDTSGRFIGGHVEHTALIDVRGTIMDQEEASADHIITGLRNAIQNKNVKGIVLRINSPGGSPVQSAYVFNEIRRLKKKSKIKIIAVCTDLCASGAYFIASACDDIYADPSSLVGSIGSIISGFGFVNTMGKLGAERRVFASGEHKNMLDPFKPLKQDEVKHIQTALAKVHQQFIKSVKLGRGDRLQTHPDIFTGLIWDGARAKELGLIDGFGSVGSVVRDVIKQEEIVDYTDKPDYFEHMSKYMSHSLVQSLATLGLAESFTDRFKLS